MARPVEPLADERVLVERAGAGDRRAFEQIYRRYARVIYAHVLVPMLGDKDDAEDCLRDTFLSAFGAMATVQWKEPGLYPWLKVLAKNKARDLMRSAGRRARLRGAFAATMEPLVPQAHNLVEQALEQERLRAVIEGVLAGMHPRYATILRMRLLQGRSRQDCADALQVKLGTVDVLLFRACRAFRQACEKTGVSLQGES